jgi:hypothetical protein
MRLSRPSSAFERWATQADREEQARHDHAHPGLVCQRCPRSVASMRAIQRKPRLRLTDAGLWSAFVLFVLMAGIAGWGLTYLAGWWVR